MRAPVGPRRRTPTGSGSTSSARASTPTSRSRVFPVGDGLLEQVRIAQNRDDVVRVVLDFKDVWEHQVFYLDNPTRLVIDVRGQAPAPPRRHGGARRPARARPRRPRPPRPPPLPVRRAARAARRDGSPGRDAGRSRPRRSRSPASTASPAPAGRRARERPAAPPRAAARAAAAAPTPAPEPPAANRAGSYSLARQLGLGARRIVIDAGHGGHDPGTIGRGGLQEKDLVLDVALRLERLVRQELGADVVLTRSTDVFIPLEERTAIANSRGADLFLSIHANASRNPSARGIETYFLNFAQDPHAEAVAARENAISPATLKDLQNLVKAITLNSKIDESRDFAAAVQESMVRGRPRGSTRSPTAASTPPPSTSSSAPTCRPCSPRSPSSRTPRTRSGCKTPRVPRAARPQPARGREELPRGPEPHPDAAIDRRRPALYSAEGGAEAR